MLIKKNNVRDFRSAVLRAPIGKTCVFIDGNLFIPFNCITDERIQLNVGNPVERSQIPSGLSNICGILNRQNYDSSEWILGKKETRLFSIRSKNRMFKERSYDLHPDFILNFGKIIKKRAWNKKDFESTLDYIDLLKYYFLAIDDECTRGIPVCFTYINNNYYVYLNNETKYIKIEKLVKILNDQNKLNSMKIINVMDWNYKYWLMLKHEDEMVLNPKIFSKILSFNISRLKVKKFIIDGKFIGSFLVLIDDQRIIQSMY